MTTDDQAVPLVCRPHAIPLLQRPGHVLLALRLFRQLGEPGDEVQNGYAYRFPAEAYDDVARFVAKERRCCPAIRFEIEVAPDGGPVELRMSGPPGAREFLAAELQLKR